MQRALIQASKCRNCQPCPPAEQCPMQAFFRETAGEKPWVDFYKCGGCLNCKPLCPARAIESISQPCNGKGRKGW